MSKTHKFELSHKVSAACGIVSFHTDLVKGHGAGEEPGCGQGCNVKRRALNKTTTANFAPVTENYRSKNHSRFSCTSHSLPDSTFFVCPRVTLILQESKHFRHTVTCHIHHADHAGTHTSLACSHSWQFVNSI